jgi:hypothetical protein
LYVGAKPNMALLTVVTVEPSGPVSGSLPFLPQVQAL